MKIVDCFIFYNELDMLRYRLSVLHEHVDWFVLVESNMTFSGKTKPFTYGEHRWDLGLREFSDKVVRVAVSDSPTSGTSWDKEWHQRNCIDQGLAETHLLHLRADDLILISDCDEIPDPVVLERLRYDVDPDSRVYTLLQHFYYWDVEHFVSPDCAAAKAVRWDAYCQKFDRKPQAVREDREHLAEQIPRAGWHLSYFGDDRFISNKIQNFSHQELNTPEHTDESVLATRRAAGEDVFGMPTPKLQYIPIAENPYPPPRLDLLPHQKL